MVRVKVCGITNLADARAAVEAGADALGFVFAKSPRKVSAEKAAGIIREIGPWVTAVGVFVNASYGEIMRTACKARLTAVQLHGDEAPELVERLKKTPFKVIKSIRVGAPEDLKGLSAFKPDAFLFDAKVSGLYGGTGKRFDWGILRSKKVTRPFIISGGLSCANVGQAVRSLPLYGVDVSSGVERSPGRKDHKLIKEFIRRAKV
jgi:phosphoribosylanthranilate isomerase